ncbi:Transcriptional activator of proteases prtT 2 [Colletotrichum chlorophyti]|uniref:Transcriptional activator of proteases prtT 2 n=1 Tax=Colletotrichum chlorophyti TaxID=708187 RepID=A0A1Q8RSE4_9PEZI|nr:Transcriptional activator of proteases prtT 2 [Colletotrichum chlorophyti]
MKRARVEGPDKTPSSASGGFAGQQMHMPKISRKIRACQECQNRKIKCGIEPGQNQCARCARLGLQCVVNKSLQTLLDSENEWKTKMELQLQTLQASLVEVRRALSLPQLVPTPFNEGGGGMSQSPANLAGSQSSPGTGPSPVRPPDVTAMTRENSPEPLAQENAEDQAIVSAPMASLFEVTKLRNIRSDPGARVHLPSNRAQEPDFIAQGKFSVDEAERLFSTFRGTLNAYLWGGIALVHDSLAATRLSSPLLTAAILAVTALHEQDEGRAFDICYPTFLELASQTMFDRYHTLDDVRGLCIGAFWLSDISWKVSGLAVRIATELNLHQFCAKALNKGGQHVEKARLWYLLYVCDHHFSIAYGRPPVINEDTTITNHEAFLQLPGTTKADDRLHSQVGVFIILSRVFHTFGPDTSRPVARHEFEALRRYDGDLGRWKHQWENRLVPDKHISNYPAKGVILHYHFARLLLFSICLRGLNPSDPSDQYAMSEERRQFINLAIASANAALELILTDVDMRRAVIGVPLYLLTTIAYAAMFLMKVHAQWKPAKLDVHYEEVVSLIDRVVVLLEESHRCVRHVAHYIGRGLSNMLDKFKERGPQERQQAVGGQPAQPGQPGQPMPQVWNEGDMVQQQLDWNHWMFGGDMMNNFGMGQEQYPLNLLDVLNSQMPG